MRESISTLFSTSKPVVTCIPTFVNASSDVSVTAAAKRAEGEYFNHEERPVAAEARDEPGADWEGDLIIDSKHKQAIVTLVDRCTRYTFMAKVPFKSKRHFLHILR